MKKRVYDQLIKRMKRYPAVLTFAIAAVVLLLTMIPAVIMLIQNKSANYDSILIVFAAELAVIMMCGLIVLMVQKGKMNGLIQAYNKYMSGLYDRLTNNADLRQNTI